jgi:hypothetical protein
MDDKRARIAPSDLLMLQETPAHVADTIAEMVAAHEVPGQAPLASTTAPSSPRSKPPARSSVICRCSGHGTVLERLERARAEQLVILDVFGHGDRASALVPCVCEAGRAVAERWRGLPAEADGVYLTNGRIRRVPEQDDARTKTLAFIKQPRGWLTLIGGYGVGKTVLIYAALNHLAARGIYGRYVMMPELLNELRDAVGTGHYAERLRRLIDAPLLAIDELDKMRESEFVDDVLNAIFLTRYRDRAKTGTIIGYNLDGARRCSRPPQRPAGQHRRRSMCSRLRRR